MRKQKDKPIEMLQGTLDLLILRTLLFGQIHGHAIAKSIERTSQNALRVDHGSLSGAAAPGASGADHRRVGHVGK
jgi:hypothetical protein